ncbi:MAG: energy transducer TonB [Terriglobia bacterium]
MGLHSALLAVLLVAPQPHHHGESWGGPGGSAVSISVVRNLPGIPLPRPEVVTPRRRATASKGLHRSSPRTEPTPPAATQLPRFGEERRRRPAREEPATETPPEAIPYGEGGPPALPYTAFRVEAAEGGMAFGSGGAFGSRYPWYVASVRRRISSNWLISTVDPYVQFAPRVVITFEILRNGSVVNIQRLRASGVPSVDRSALRAIRDSSPFDRLPSDYRGNKVLVEFWFDFHR